MDTAALSEQFKMLLERGAQELFEDNRHRMMCADLLATRHTIAEDDLRRFFLGLQCGALTLVRGARFNTLDRPATGGRWGLLSRGKRGCRYNAEYLSQISAYVEAIHELGYPSERVFFELPHVALKLDLAILGDDGGVLVLGEAKRAVFMGGRAAQGDPGPVQHRGSGRGGSKRGSPTRLAPVANPNTLLLVHRSSRSTRVSRAL
jgi:hypothetical protein